MNVRNSFAPVLLAGVVGLLSACGPGETPVPDAGTPPTAAAEADKVKSTVVVQPALGAYADGEDQVTITVTVKHRTGASLSGQTVLIEATGAGNTLSQPLAPTDTTGIVTATLRSTIPEMKTLTVKVTNEDGKEVVLDAKPTVEFAELPATQFVFETQPSPSAVAGASLGTLRLAVKNKKNELVRTNVPVNLVLQASNNAELLGTISGSTVEGVVEFTNVNVTKAGTGYRIIASATGLPDVSSEAFDIVPAAPSLFVVSGFTPGLKAGVASSIQIGARDRFDNLATNYSGTVRFTSSDPQATLPGDTVFTSSNGFLLLTDAVTFKKTGNQTVTVTAVADPTVTGTGSTSIGPGDPAKLEVLTPQPLVVTTNTPFTVAIALRDEFGNETQATTPAVTIAFAGTVAGQTLTGTRTVTPADGTATFTDLVIDNENSGAATVKLEATATGLTLVQTMSFAVTDVTPPATPTLNTPTVGATNVLLSWTAPGDDGMTGPATSYELKFATTRFTAATFATHGTAVTPAPAAPKAQGGSESYDVTGLTADTFYYFALKTTDSAGNSSYAFATNAGVVDYCKLDTPSSLTLTSAQASSNVFGVAYELNVTESVGGSLHVLAELGFGPSNTDPRNDTTWQFSPATFSSQAGNDERYQATLTAPTVTAQTQYAYTYRFGFDGVNWTYCDLDGAGSNGGLSFDTAQLGTLTVNP